MQLVNDAIDESQGQDKIAHIELDDIARAGSSYEDVIDALGGECEDNVENGTVHEFWGTDEHGTWRVHVAREVV